MARLSELIAMNHVFIAEVDTRTGKATVRAFWSDHALRSPFEFNLKGTPCGDVCENREIIIGHDTRQRYPEAPLLQKLTIESYIGVPLLGASGAPLGTICAFDPRPVEDFEQRRSIIALFSSRVTAELERLRAETELRKSERMHATLLSNLSGMAYRCANDPDWTMEFVSGGCLGLTGYLPADLIGSVTVPYADLIVEEDRDEVWRLVQEANQGRRPFVLQYRIRTLDGAVKWVWEQGRAVFDAEGRVESIEGYITDISALKFAEEDRERLILELQFKNDELGRFAHTVSHDLKSPLIAIRGYLEILEQGNKAGNFDRFPRCFERMGGAISRMLQLLDELGRYARVDAPLGSREPVDLMQAAREAALAMEELLLERRVRLEIDPVSVVIEGERIRVIEVFQNLIENAVKFMGRAESPRIEIGSQVHPDVGVFVFVRDNGMGIPKIYQERIFNMFDRLHPEIEGTGTGLAIVRRIVENHGGRIWVESEGESQGSRFCLSFPHMKTSTPSAQ